MRALVRAQGLQEVAEGHGYTFHVGAVLIGSGVDRLDQDFNITGLSRQIGQICLVKTTSDQVSCL